MLRYMVFIASVIGPGKTGLICEIHFIKLDILQLQSFSRKQGSYIWQGLLFQMVDFWVNYTQLCENAQWPLLHLQQQCDIEPNGQLLLQLKALPSHSAKQIVTHNLPTSLYVQLIIKPEPNMFKILPIIPSSTSLKIYPLFLFYSPSQAQELRVPRSHGPHFSIGIKFCHANQILLSLLPPPDLSVFLCSCSRIPKLFFCINVSGMY